MLYHSKNPGQQGMTHRGGRTAAIEPVLVVKHAGRDVVVDECSCVSANEVIMALTQLHSSITTSQPATLRMVKGMLCQPCLLM